MAKGKGQIAKGERTSSKRQLVKHSLSFAICRTPSILFPFFHQASPDVNTCRAFSTYLFAFTQVSPFPFSLLLFTFVFCNSAHCQNTLSFYINAATQNNPLIYENNNLNRINTLDEDRLKAIYTKPQTGLTGIFLFAPIITTDNNKIALELNSTGADKYFGYDLGTTNGGQYQGLFNISQPLYGEKKLNIAKEQLKVSSQINLNSSKITTHDIERNITDQYLLCLVDLKQIQFAQSMIELINGQRDILKKLVEASIYKQSDLVLLNIESQNFVAQIANSRASYRRNLMDLNVLAAITDTTLVTLQDFNLTLTPTLESSPFLERYRLDSLNIRANQRISELKYEPQISAFGNAGLSATDLNIWPRRLGFSVGLTASYTLFDGNQKTINKNKNDIFVQTINFYRTQFENQNTLRKSKIVKELESFAERTAILEQQLKDYRSLMELYKKEIITGQISIVNYTTAIKNMALVQLNSNLLTAQRQSLINLYNYWNW